MLGAWNSAAHRTGNWSRATRSAVTGSRRSSARAAWASSSGARDGDGRAVALKVLKRELAATSSSSTVSAGSAGGRRGARPHLVPIIEAAEADGRHYLASTTSPAARSATASRRRPLPVAELVRVISEVATGLDALHAAGIVHRDIKPPNILFDSDGTAMLTDFGLAKGAAYTVLTKPGQVMGTLDYLAPELIRGQPATPATDVYALGCLAFECAAGKGPFADKGSSRSGSRISKSRRPIPAAERPELSPGTSPPLFCPRSRKTPSNDLRAPERSRACCAPPTRKETRMTGARLQAGAARRPERRGRRGARHRPRGRRPDDRGLRGLAPSRRPSGPWRAGSRSRTWARSTGRSSTACGSTAPTRLAGGDRSSSARASWSSKSRRAAGHGRGSRPAPAAARRLPAPARLPPAASGVPSEPFGTYAAPEGRQAPPRHREPPARAAARLVVAVVVATAVALAVYFADH